MTHLPDQPWRPAFDRQAQACAGLGSPFMARLMTILPDLLRHAPETLARLQAWTGELGPEAASLPLRIAGGLHYLVLTGRAQALAACYPPHPHHGLEGALSDTLAAHDDWLSGWMLSAPQTNEVGRSGVLIPAAMALSARFGLPLRLSELGASAGLNLNLDRYGFRAVGRIVSPDARPCLAPEWAGNPPVITPLCVADRRGVDLNPLDPQRDRERLLAYVWPDQAERLERVSQAIEVAARHPVQLDQGDAAGWLGKRLSTPWPGQCHIVYHTVAHQYFPQEVQDSIARQMSDAGAQATETAPLAWMGMEADATKGSAAITLRLWPGDLRITLGRAGFHGQWVKWQGMS